MHPECRLADTLCLFPVDRMGDMRKAYAGLCFGASHGIAAYCIVLLRNLRAFPPASHGDKEHLAHQGCGRIPRFIG